MGKKVKTISNPSISQTINTNQFSKGVYMVQILTNAGEIVSEKLVIR
jgi:hypothetical protein